MNQKICISGVEVCPGDLVFADSEGVAIIPRAVIDQVFGEVRNRFRNERAIVADIAAGASPAELVDQRGAF
jgi:regulator of RNase E activity RraA